MERTAGYSRTNYQLEIDTRIEVAKSGDMAYSSDHHVTPDELIAFAHRYAEAWCSKNPDEVAKLFAENGSLSVNQGARAVGRMAIADVARGFMRDLPDMIVTCDKLEQSSNACAASGCDAVFHWTLTGTNTGPGGSGKPIRVSGYEMWKFDPDGFIAESTGHFDAGEYERQITG